jgi:hypothetical protein
MRGRRRHFVYVAHFIPRDAILLRRLRQKLKETFSADTIFQTWLVRRLEHRHINSDDSGDPALGESPGDHGNVGRRASIDGLQTFLGLTARGPAREISIDLAFDRAQRLIVELCRTLTHLRRNPLFLFINEAELLCLAHLGVNLFH